MQRLYGLFAWCLVRYRVGVKGVGVDRVAMSGNKKRRYVVDTLVSLCIVQLAIVFIASFNRLPVTPVSHSCCGLTPVIGLPRAGDESV